MRSGLSALSILAMLSLALGVPIAADANVLVNGGFEDMPNWGASNGSACGGANTTCSALSGSQLPGWTIESGHLVTVHVAGIYPTVSGIYSINTDGEGFGGANADFYQDFPSVPGRAYAFQFDWYGWTSTTARLDVTVVDTVTSAELYHGNFAWSAGSHHVTASFTGTGNTLRLRVLQSPASGTNDNGFVVDNFDVESQQAAQPVPGLNPWLAALLALVAAVTGTFALRRRA